MSRMLRSVCSAELSARSTRNKRRFDCCFECYCVSLQEHGQALDTTAFKNLSTKVSVYKVCSVFHFDINLFAQAVCVILASSEVEVGSENTMWCAVMAWLHTKDKGRTFADGAPFWPLLRFACMMPCFILHAVYPFLIAYRADRASQAWVDVHNFVSMAGMYHSVKEKNRAQYLKSCASKFCVDARPVPADAKEPLVITKTYTLPADPNEEPVVEYESLGFRDGFVVTVALYDGNWGVFCHHVPTSCNFSPTKVLASAAEIKYSVEFKDWRTGEFCVVPSTGSEMPVYGLGFGVRAEIAFGCEYDKHDRKTSKVISPNNEITIRWTIYNIRSP